MQQLGAICSGIVPAFLFFTKLSGYSKGELPYFQSFSYLSVTLTCGYASICLPILMQSATLSTGIIHLAPLCNAVA